MANSGREKDQSTHKTSKMLIKMKLRSLVSLCGRLLAAALAQAWDYGPSTSHMYCALNRCVPLCTMVLGDWTLQTMDIRHRRFQIKSFLTEGAIASSLTLLAPILLPCVCSASHQGAAGIAIQNRSTVRLRSKQVLPVLRMRWSGSVTMRSMGMRLATRLSRTIPSDVCVSRLSMANW
jgi:hypothetical protein